MNGWENQYIRLVTTKPEIIVAERDRESPARSKAAIDALKGSYQKLFVEIGSGSGMHLLRLAEQHPDTLCIGIEIRFKRAFKTGEKAERRSLHNVLVIRADARCLSDLFEDDQVSAFFINYPDPWDKRRWRKNRIVSEQMLLTMRRLLSPQGFIRYKTDHKEYFESTTALFRNQGWSIKKQSANLLNSQWAEENIPTEFECLFKSQNKPLHLLEVEKTDSANSL